MCGIVGFVNINRDTPKGGLVDDLKRMNKCISHRGKESEGYHLVGEIDKNIGRYRIGLGHQRVAIIDLTDRGFQPMLNDDKKISPPCLGLIPSPLALIIILHFYKT